MDTDTSLNLVERSAGLALLHYVVPAWLMGISLADQTYRGFSSGEQQLVEEILAQWLPLAPLEYQRFPRECLRAQLVNVAKRVTKSGSPRDAVLWLQRVAEMATQAERASRPGLFARLIGARRRMEAWGPVRTTLSGIRSAEMPHLMDLWLNLPDDVKQWCRSALPVGAMDSELSKLRWLDAARRQKAPEDDAVMRAYGVLSDEACARHFEQCLTLHKHPSLKVREFVAAIALPRLAVFGRGLSDEQFDRMKACGVDRYSAAYTRRGVSVNAQPDGSWVPPSASATSDEIGWADGVALEPAHEQAASCAEVPVDESFVDPSGHRLHVLLSIDLRAPEVAFLGLSGTHLRICAPGESTGEPMFTRVDFDANASLHESTIESLQSTGEIAEESEPARNVMPWRKRLVATRPLRSPFEGGRRCGYLGASAFVGGNPAWQQDPEIPRSPVTHEPMRYIAQVPWLDHGEAYVFIDVQSMIVAVVHQID